ncbi:MAG: UDP-N-acetylglucosamine 1-carboxyvinyltransferase, partial [Bacteroidales bacterium]|nr:UDP-N-acetylglucosamine 1-carboxyvinyltransferase [Bacteroidales bacterium]
MSSFIIEGGHRLKGEIIPQGAKNEALQVICATLLTEEEVIIENIPDILDVNNLIGLLMAMGVEVGKLKKDSWSFKAANINQEYIQTKDFIDKCASLRGSIMIIGPLLARFGRVSIPKPGGDKIGRRRLDTHFNAIQKLGAKLDLDEKNQLFCLSADQLKGCYILLDEASVTGTANLLMAAVMAEGETIIYNAACEPYV